MLTHRSNRVTCSHSQSLLNENRDEDFTPFYVNNRINTRASLTSLPSSELSGEKLADIKSIAMRNQVKAFARWNTHGRLRMRGEKNR